MGTEFGWWAHDPDQGKFQVRAFVHGGNVAWERKQGHGSSWSEHAATDVDWDRLFAEAEKRVPRRLLSPKQFEAIKNLRPR
jgi:hypothetical protein